MASADQTLDACGCCEGITQLTPQLLINLPGLSTVAYRVGTHGSFKSSLLTGLSGPGGLPQLTTRRDDDPAIALLDACATLLDVLTFYQERIANEGYLRTATERLSVLELARTIGYELNPGVAASTYLAFEMETAPTAPTTATIPVGTKVQSLPGQDEKPQTFETVELIEARTIWNRIKPQTFQLILPQFGDTTIYLQGTATNLKQGDALLLIGDERKGDSGNENWDFRRVQAVTTVTPTSGPGYTVVTLDRGLGSIVPHVEPAKKSPKVYALRLRANLYGYNAPDWRSMPKSVKSSYLGLLEADLDKPENQDLLLSGEWPGFTIASISDPPTTVATGTGLYGEYFNGTAFQQRKLARTDATINFAWGVGSPAPGIIGVDAFSVRWTGWIQPKVAGEHIFFTTSDDGVRLWVNGQLLINNWTDHPPRPDQGTIRLEAGRKYDLKLEFYENGGGATITLSWSAPGLAQEIIPAAQLYPRDLHNVHLDAIYPQLVAGSWVVLSTPEYQEVYQIDAIAEDSRANFTLSAKTTHMTLKGENLRAKFNEKLRETVVFAQSEELLLAAQPVTTPLQGDTLVLDQLLLDLNEQKTLLVTGKPMRAQVRQALTLTARDGSSSVIPVDASLQVTQAPVTLLTGQEQWTFTDKNNFTGTVLLNSSDVSARFTLTSALANDALVSEVVFIKQITAQSDPTELVLTVPLANLYDRPTVFIYANVARATHGETRQEVLGSGDAAQLFQNFTLKQTPLTYVAAPTASGAQSTLQVRVNDILWTEKPSLYSLAARDRAYITRQADDEKTKVQFGDGVNGARLPTGVENVTATYRSGIGSAGMVKVGQLSLLMTRPLGVQKVTNPLAPTGAADPEDRDNARQNAPFTVLTLDRVVSLTDFENFARAFAGIGKAQAITLWNGENRLVYLTIAAAATNGLDFTVDPTSALFQNLRLAMDAARDTVQRLEVASYAPLFFKLAARLLIDPAYLTEKVIAAATSALTLAYSFAQRDFGQAVDEGEVLAILQEVAGVKAVFLDQLYFKGDVGQLQSPLPARGARRDTNGSLKPAQLLLLDPNGVSLTPLLS